MTLCNSALEFLEDPRCEAKRLAGAEVLMNLGLDELSKHAAELCISDRQNHFAALIFLFELHKNRGELDLCESTLERLEALASKIFPSGLNIFPWRLRCEAFPRTPGGLGFQDCSLRLPLVLLEALA